MNRRRILSGVHRAIARHEAAPQTTAADMPLTRLSFADLNAAGAALLPRPVREVCSDCMGSRETVQQVTDGLSVTAPCAECGGRGYLEEGR